MKRTPLRPVWLGLVLLVGAAGCRDDGPLPLSDLAQPADDLAQRDDARGPADLAVARDLAPADLGLQPNPPPAQCNQRRPGVTAIQVALRIDEYRGLMSGRNGVHEIVEGTILAIPWVYQGMLVDTHNVELAMNVASDMDPAGLPQEVRMSPGQIIEAEGEYLPAASVDVTNKNGMAAVLHFTHAPCGYVVIAGRRYN